MSKSLSPSNKLDHAATVESTPVAISYYQREQKSVETDG